MTRELTSNQDQLRKQAKSYALFLLARREYSCYELTQKLLVRFPKATFIGELVEELAAADWVSDKRFVESFVRAKSLKGFGPKCIRYELQQKGIQELLLEELVDQAQINWIDIAVTLLAKRMRGKPADSACRQKQQRYLYQRGFDADQIKTALNQYDELQKMNLD